MASTVPMTVRDATGNTITTIDPESGEHATDLMSGSWWWSSDRQRLVLDPEGEWHRDWPAVSDPICGSLIPVTIEPSGVTEWQVRESSREGERVDSRHRTLAAAQRARREVIASFERTHSGGYGFAWHVTDQDGRKLLGDY